MQPNHAPPERHDHHTYPRDERPAVEVRYQDEWYHGIAYARWRDDSGQLWYWVQWRRPETQANAAWDFAGEDVRLAGDVGGES